ncbi:MAG TPA: hypothetical protein PKC28_06745 [Bdellovibrionales bacterium]|nr:hypothetical protein [Bdellovibrionales bacterium]
MNILISAEHFELAPQHKKRIESSLLKILDRVPRAENLRLFMKRDSRQRFEVTLLVHSRHQDVTCTKRGYDLLQTVFSAKSHLLQRLASQKERRLEQRKNRGLDRVSGL